MLLAAAHEDAPPICALEVALAALAAADGIAAACAPPLSRARALLRRPEERWQLSHIERAAAAAERSARAAAAALRPELPAREAAAREARKELRRRREAEVKAAADAAKREKAAKRKEANAARAAAEEREDAQRRETAAEVQQRLAEERRAAWRRELDETVRLVEHRCIGCRIVHGGPAVTNTECPICLRSFETSERLWRLSCGHGGCEECFHRLIRRDFAEADAGATSSKAASLALRCPLCRRHYAPMDDDFDDAQLRAGIAASLESFPGSGDGGHTSGPQRWAEAAAAAEAGARRWTPPSSSRSATPRPEEDDSGDDVDEEDDEEEEEEERQRVRHAAREHRPGGGGRRPQGERPSGSAAAPRGGAKRRGRSTPEPAAPRPSRPVASKPSRLAPPALAAPDEAERRRRKELLRAAPHARVVRRLKATLVDAPAQALRARAAAVRRQYVNDRAMRAVVHLAVGLALVLAVGIIVEKAA